MLIVDAKVHGYGSHGVCVRIAGGRVSAIGALPPAPGESILDACGGLLLPGLCDHHVHLLSFAAALESVRCGPPEVTTPEALTAALHARAAAQRTSGDAAGWIRGIGYHESVAGDIDRRWLDRHGPDAAVRVQHRSGRLWIVNSRALDRLAEAGARLPGHDGRLFDLDRPLRALFGAVLPPVAEASARLASYGVTALTDMTADNDAEALATFAGLRADGRLLQRMRVAGTADLPAARPGVTTGETKFHLHEHDLPPFELVRAAIARSHGAGRPVAVHCVTETELVFTLAALREAGAMPGDRIEHASVTPPGLIEQIQALGLTVVTQPHFVRERGDVYLRELPAAEHQWLYRAGSFAAAGIPLAAGSDAPFGGADPWAAMQAAVARSTAGGALLGEAEKLSPDQALALFLGRPDAPACPQRVEPGATADLCLLDSPWSRVCDDLSSRHVVATWVDGAMVWQRSDPRPDPTAHPSGGASAPGG